MHSWEQRKVSEIAIEKLSNGIMNNQVNNETGLRHINVINMYDSDKIHPEKLTFSGYDEDAVKKCNVELGDIFLTRSSLKPEGIAEANVLLDSGRFVYDDHLIRLKVDKENYDPFFVKLNLSERTFKRQFIVRAKTTAFTTIGQEDIAECSGLFPKREEQEKIGIYFSNLDHLITLHQRKCDETKTLKKYMLQKMFPQNGEKVPEIRSDGFTEDWEQRKVTELLKNSSSAMKIGPFGSALKKDYFVEKGIKVYAQENAFTGDFSMGDYYITEDKYKELKSCELYPGDLVISMMGTIGACAIFPENAEKGIMNSHLLRLQFNNEVIPEYIMYLLRDSDLIRKQIDRLSVGSIMSGLSSSVVKKLVFPIPKLAEQKKIVKYLDSIGNLITLHQRKCNELKEIKKYMLQNMFV